MLTCKLANAIRNVLFYKCIINLLLDGYCHAKCLKGISLSYSGELGFQKQTTILYSMCIISMNFDKYVFLCSLEYFFISMRIFFPF